jgi:hypothetical protein
MAQLPKNHIHDPIYQITDFFRDDQMRRLLPKNPYNIYWMIEHYLLKKYEKIDQQNGNNYYCNQLKDIQSQCLYCIQQNTDYDNLKSFTDDILKDEYVLKRVQELHQKHAISLDFLASRVVRTKSQLLLNGLLDLGMNPNTYGTKNFPMQVALNRKLFKIFTILWNHPRINREQKIQLTNENMAFIAIKEKSWKSLEIIFKDAPQLFLEKNKYDETVLDVISKFNHGECLFKKSTNKFLIDNIPSKMKNLFIQISNLLDDNDIHSLYKTNPDVNEIVLLSRHMKLEKALNPKTSQTKTIKL